MDPVKLFTVIVLISLPTVMFGGYALLDLLSRKEEADRVYNAPTSVPGTPRWRTAGNDAIALAVLDRTEFGDGARWVACILLAVGVLAQSSGMFLHMAIGKPGGGRGRMPSPPPERSASSPRACSPPRTADHHLGTSAKPARRHQWHGR